MGCGSSKHIDATAAVYRPAPSSFAVFDINAIEEPWLKHLNNVNSTQLPLEPEDKPTRTHVPAPILHKLNNMLEATEAAPQSWDEVSKALVHDLKPPSTPPKQPPQKSVSFHTVEELEAKLITPKPNKPKPKPDLTKAATTNWNRLNESKPEEEEEGGVKIKPLKDNIFIVRDRLEREKEEKVSNYDKIRWNPLSQFPEKCPPGGSDSVVIYTTSLGGVRKTFEDCNRARDLLEGHRVVFDERDVSLHGEFLKELKEVVGEGGVLLPRVFVKGRYLGGLDELLELNETGRLGRILNATRVERGVGRQACGGCGGARFVPCLECGGSCKIGLNKERCPDCNENGLVHCPTCI